MLYLIGRTELKLEEDRLRRVIARWFFMSSLTGRYTASPESDFEFDLARLRTVGSGEEFANLLDAVCDATLTNDFWSITLPNALATSAARSPSLFAFSPVYVKDAAGERFYVRTGPATSELGGRDALAFIQERFGT